MRPNLVVTVEPHSCLEAWVATNRLRLCLEFMELDKNNSVQDWYLFIERAYAESHHNPYNQAEYFQQD